MKHGHRKRATPAERLASMERELSRRIAAHGDGSDMVNSQRESIAKEKDRQEQAKKSGIREGFLGYYRTTVE